jgi:dUTP pyrophosphatase
MKKEECYNCGCNLKEACPEYEEEETGVRVETGMKVRVQRVHAEAKLPVRAHPTDAGMDLFYCPPPKKELPNQIETVLPHGTALLPTGLKIEVPKGYMLEIKNKSGIATKRGLLVGACVVDRHYTGEVFVNLHNVTQRNQIIKAGQKIAQAVFVKITTQVSLVESDSIYDEESSRGDGALGSTGDY